MTTIVYHKGCLLTDTRHIKEAYSLRIFHDYPEHKGILLPNEKGEIIGVLAITGTQPEGVMRQKYIDFLTKKETIAELGPGMVFDGTVTAILMYRHAAYVLKPGEKEGTVVVHSEITESDAVGTGGQIALMLLDLGEPIETLMAQVSKYDSYSSPVTNVIYQEDLVA